MLEEDGTFMIKIDTDYLDDKGSYTVQRNKLILNGERFGIIHYRIVSYEDKILVLRLRGETECCWIKLSD